MRHYFNLQSRLISRHIDDFGLPPVLGPLLGALLFIALSIFLFIKTELAVYVYLLVALSTLTNLSGGSRNEFLRTCFTDGDYRQVRLLENAIVALPFFGFLLFKAQYLPAAGLTLGAVLLVFLNFDRSDQFTLPTPFGKRPFEFVVGFRKTFYLYGLAYFLTIMAVVVDNFNLGAFSMLGVFVACLSYYGDLEPGFYVWVHAQGPKAFLWEKIKTALLYSTLLCLPVVATLAIFFWGNAYIILAVLFVGNLYLTTMILAKYSAYPQAIGLPQSILLAMSLTLPPLLLFIIPFFYKNSIKHLNRVLA